MLGRLGRFSVAHRKAVLVGTALFFVLAATLGGGVASHLTSGGFNDPNSESSRARDAIKHDFGKQEPDLALLVTAKRASLHAPDPRTAGPAPGVGGAAARLPRRVPAEPKVARVVSYWSVGRPPPLRSTDGRQALVLVSLRGDDAQVLDAAKELSPRYTSDGGAITVRVGG